MKAIQLTNAPTNKLAVGMTVGPAVATLFSSSLGPAVAEVWPTIVPLWLAGPGVTNLVTGLITVLAGAIAAWASAYWVKDALNVPAE
jgi:hypothetical protein